MTHYDLPRRPEPRAVKYLTEFGIDYDDLHPLGLNEYGAMIKHKGFLIKVFWPEGFDFRTFRNIGNLVAFREPSMTLL